LNIINIENPIANNAQIGIEPLITGWFINCQNFTNAPIPNIKIGMPDAKANITKGENCMRL